MAPPPHFGTRWRARGAPCAKATVRGNGATGQSTAKASQHERSADRLCLGPVDSWAVGCPARCSLGRLRPGVILDCGRHEVGNGKKEDDDWWLELYVLLSRATRHEDLLLMRAPRIEFFLAGPPEGLRKQLEQFAARTKRCRREATALARELGFTEFIREA